MNPSSRMWVNILCLVAAVGCGEQVHKHKSGSPDDPQLESVELSGEVTNASALVASDLTESAPPSISTYLSCPEKCLNIISFGAFGDGKSHPITEDQLAEKGWKVKYRVNDEWDTIGLTEAIAAAKPGDTIYFPRGKYQIYRNAFTKRNFGFKFLPGLNYVGDGALLVAPSDNPVSMAVLFPLSTPADAGIAVRGIGFMNILISFDGTLGPNKFGRIKFETCSFDSDASELAAHLVFNTVSNVRIQDSSFARSSRSPGRSISLVGVSDVAISGSRFSGHLTSSINIGAAAQRDGSRKMSERVTISSNTIVRAPGTYAEDHGIYVLVAKSVSLFDNEIRGWSYTPSGGAIKIRNAEDILVLGNRLYDSGIMLYSYQANEPRYLKRVLIERNSVDLSKSVGVSGVYVTDRPGISYWKNFSSATPAEESIVIQNNDVIAGSIAIYPPASGEAFVVQWNRASDFHFYAKGVRGSGNTKK